MESPSAHWPEAILEEEDIEQLKEDFDSCKHKIVQWTEMRYDNGLAPGETPEFAACVIGEMAYENHKSDNFFKKVINNKMSGEAGKKLAKGYIGIQAIEEADV